MQHIRFQICLEENPNEKKGKGGSNCEVGRAQCTNLWVVKEKLLMTRTGVPLNFTKLAGYQISHQEGRVGMCHEIPGRNACKKGSLESTTALQMNRQCCIHCCKLVEHSKMKDGASAVGVCCQPSNSPTTISSYGPHKQWSHIRSKSVLPSNDAVLALGGICADPKGIRLPGAQKAGLQWQFFYVKSDNFFELPELHKRGVQHRVQRQADVSK